MKIRLENYVKRRNALNRLRRYTDDIIRKNFTCVFQIIEMMSFLYCFQQISHFISFWTELFPTKIKRLWCHLKLWENPENIARVDELSFYSLALKPLIQLIYLTYNYKVKSEIIGLTGRNINPLTMHVNLFTFVDMSLLLVYCIDIESGTGNKI